MSATSATARHTPVAGRARALDRATGFVRSLTLTDALLLLALLVVTLTKLYWEPLGKLVLSNVVAAAFVLAFVAQRVRARDTRISRDALVAAAFMVAFALVFALGFFNIDTPLERTQFYKGFATWAIRAAFLVCMTAHVAREGRRLFHLCVAVILAGAALNAGYGVLQLVVWGLFQVNLDAVVLSNLSFSVGGSRGIQLFGAGIYRINGLMRDTNHFGVMLAAPLALSLVFLRGRLRVLVAALLFGALVLSLSRSGGVAALAALAVLALPFRRALVSRQVVFATLAAIVALVAFTQLFPELWNSIVLSRLDPGSRSAQTHIGLYTVVPGMLQQHPLLGHGLNTFAIHFADISGREEFGPHSYYIQLLAENGVLGFSLFVVFAAAVLAALVRARHPLAIALAAAIVGTWVGNLFYLTTQIAYVDALYALAFAAPAALASALQSDAHARRNPAANRESLAPEH